MRRLGHGVRVLSCRGVPGRQASSALVTRLQHPAARRAGWQRGGLWPPEAPSHVLLRLGRLCTRCCLCTRLALLRQQRSRISPQPRRGIRHGGSNSGRVATHCCCCCCCSCLFCCCCFSGFGIGFLGVGVHGHVARCVHLWLYGGLIPAVVQLRWRGGRGAGTMIGHHITGGWWLSQDAAAYSPAGAAPSAATRWPHLHVAGARLLLGRHGSTCLGAPGCAAICFQEVCMP
jgi:hypothetical protein